MFPTPQSPIVPAKQLKSELENYIDDILVRARLASEELDLLIASIPKGITDIPIQFDKPKVVVSSGYIPESPRSIHSLHYQESSIHHSPVSSFFPDSMFSMPSLPPRPSSSCERRPANLRAHRILNPSTSFAIEADDEDDGGFVREESFISVLPQKSGRASRSSEPFVDLTNSIENLPHFQYVHDSPKPVTISRSEPQSEEGLAWKRERLLLEIMRNYGEEFS